MSYAENWEHRLEWATRDIAKDLGLDLESLTNDQLKELRGAINRQIAKNDRAEKVHIDPKNSCRERIFYFKTDKDLNKFIKEYGPKHITRDGQYREMIIGMDYLKEKSYWYREVCIRFDADTWNEIKTKYKVKQYKTTYVDEKGKKRQRSPHIPTYFLMEVD